MTEELFAAGKAMELARKGVPFRDAYRAVGRKYA
jgi:argininosuccinate lyase